MPINNSESNSNDLIQNALFLINVLVITTMLLSKKTAIFTFLLCKKIVKTKETLT